MMFRILFVGAVICFTSLVIGSSSPSAAREAKLEWSRVLNQPVSKSARKTNAGVASVQRKTAEKGDTLGIKRQRTRQPSASPSTTRRTVARQKPVDSTLAANQSHAPGTGEPKASQPTDYTNLLLQIAAILAIFFAGWMFAKYQLSLAVKREVIKKIRQSFEILPWKIVAEQRQAFDDHKKSFYSGVTDVDPSVDICLDLDAKRREHERLLGLMKQKSSEEWFHISIFGDRKQGKTIFLARLANELALQKTRFGFGRRYVVLWCKRERNTPFRQDLEEGRSLEADLLDEYRKYYSPRQYFGLRRKPLVVFIDDMYRPEIHESSTIFEESSIRSFVLSLMKLRINLVTSSSNDELDLDETTESIKLRFDATDASRVLDKMVNLQIVTREFASAFPGSPQGQKFYKKQMFAFFSSMLAQKGFELFDKSGFVKDFEERYDGLTDEEKSAFKMIALCQLVDALVLESTMRTLFPSSLEHLKNGLGGIVRRASVGKGSFGYHLGGPFLATKLLSEKYGSLDASWLKSAFSEVVDKICKSEPVSAEGLKLVLLLLQRLSSGWHYPVLQIPGGPIVTEIWKSIRDVIVPKLQKLGEPSSISGWATAARELGNEELSTSLYFESLRLMPPVQLAQTADLRYYVSLGFAMSNSMDKRVKEEVIVLFQAIIERFVKEGYDPWGTRRVVHKLTDVLNGMGRPQQTLALLDSLPAELPLDSLLWQTRGDAFEALDRLDEASGCFEKSIETARAEGGKTGQTLFNCLQHYASFLSNHVSFSTSHQKNLETYLSEARGLAADKRARGLESLLSVAAKYQKNQGAVVEAKKSYEECIAYCREEGIFKPYTWNDYARLLTVHAREFKEKPPEHWLAVAEDFCREVNNAGGVEPFTRMVTNHILGGAVGLNNYVNHEGKPRPNFEEALSVLEQAFESPLPDRNDDSAKTFQDAITHRLVKDVYVRWSDSQADQQELNRLIEKADFHFQRSFVGLPRANIFSTHVCVHVLETESAYAFFKARRREDFEAAENHYKAAIQKREELDVWWPEAYKLYEFYGNFAHDYRKENHALQVALYRQALQFLPKSNTKKKAMISHKLAHCLQHSYMEFLKSRNYEKAEEGLEGAISAFDTALGLAPFDDQQREFPAEWSAAKTLAHLFFAPGFGIVRNLCTKERVDRIVEILWRTWVSCPSNVEALDGILTVADSLIDRFLHDGVRTRELATSIKDQAASNDVAASILAVVCGRRKANPHRGLLTHLLDG